MEQRIKTLRIFIMFVGVVLLLLTVNVVEAGIRKDKDEVCPIGGEEFVSPGTLSCTSLGVRFDFKPINSCEWVRHPVICPKNGFPIYKSEFTTKEIERLSVIVETDDFQNNRIGNVPSFMLYHLKKILGESDSDLALAILPAIWDAHEFSSEKLPTYLDLAIEHNQRALDTIDHDQKWWHRQILTANLERRRGLFEAALKRIDSLSTGDIAPDSYLNKLLNALRKFIINRNTEPQKIP
jgi:hypothetical protein